MILIGGIEGGSTNSRMILVNETGKKLGYAEGPQTNPWSVGMTLAAERLITLVHNSLLSAHLAPTVTLTYLGLSLSGADTPENEQEIIDEIKKLQPNLATRIRVTNDSIGTFLTYSDNAALVLISGTGSICNYVRKDLSFARIGGYGYMLGDGGSAYWIVHHAIQILIETDEHMIPHQFDLERLRTEVYRYFKIENTLELLPIFYTTFEKSRVAGLGQYLAIAANEGDEVCKHCFHLAGIELSRLVQGGLWFAFQDLGSSMDQIKVICCGSMFKSWNLLRSGFCEQIKPKTTDKLIGKLNLFCIKSTAAYGAARLVNYSDLNIRIPIYDESAYLIDEIDFGFNPL